MLTMRDDLAALRNRFELTPAEAKLALRLAAGDTLRASARTLGVSYETARTTLKSVFHKTNTCRQVALVIVVINELLEKHHEPQQHQRLDQAVLRRSGLPAR